MSYTEARSHFETAKNTTPEKAMIDLLDGLKHLSHAFEEDVGTLERNIRDVRDILIEKKTRYIDLKREIKRT
jgi:hypothetical protein